MKAITITKKNAIIQHDGIVAHSPDGRPVFILPGKLAAAQLSVHPKGMVVYSVPEQHFPEYVEALLRCEDKQLSFAVRGASERGDNPQSELRPHRVDLGAEGTQKKLG
jgi:hypothetical protein